MASVTGVVTSLVDSLAATKEKIKTDLPEKVVYLDALKANLDELQKQFNALSAEDQMKAAQFLAANSSLLSSKAALGSLGMLKWDWSVLDGDSGQLVMDTAKFAVVGTLFIAAATTTAPVWLTIGLAVATVSVAYRVIDDIAGVSTTRVMDDQSATVEDNSGSTMLKALAGQTIYFAQGVEKLLKAEALFRALGDEDRNSDDPVVKKIFKALDGLNPTWDQASAALPQSLGAVPTLGAGKETTETLKPALFSVNNASVQPNTVHIVTASTAIDGFKITFDGPSGDFTFSMIYVDDNGTVEIPVNGHLGCDPANPKSCPGCCDSNGACRTGDTTDACGKDGQTCMDCSGGSARYEGACHKPEKVCCNVSGSYCNDAPCCSNMCSRVDCCDYIPGTGYFCP